MYTGRVSWSGDVHQQCWLHGNGWHYSWFRRQDIHCTG